MVWDPEGWSICTVPWGEKGSQCLSARGVVDTGPSPFQMTFSPSNPTDINNDTHRPAEPCVCTSWGLNCLIQCGISEWIAELLSPLSKAIYRVLKLCPWKHINTVSHLACRKAIILYTKRGRKVILLFNICLLCWVVKSLTILKGSGEECRIPVLAVLSQAHIYPGSTCCCLWNLHFSVLNIIYQMKNEGNPWSRPGRCILAYLTAPQITKIYMRKNGKVSLVPSLIICLLQRAP